MKRMLFAMALFATLCLNQTRAAVLEFTVDSSLSSLTITPTVSIFGNPLSVTPQGPGAFTASYSGTLFADLTPVTIQLLSPSTLIAAISGNWKPGTDYSNYPGDNSSPNGYINTAAPANYGTVTDLTLVNGTISTSAIRNLEIGLSDLVPKPLVGGTFVEAGTLTDYTAGTIYLSSGASPPITDMANTLFPGPTVDAVGTGTLTKSGAVRTLTIPVSFSVSYNISVLALTTFYNGTIVATAVPEPASLVLLGTLAMACVFKRQR